MPLIYQTCEVNLSEDMLRFLGAFYNISLPGFFAMGLWTSMEVSNQFRKLDTVKTSNLVGSPVDLSYTQSEKGTFSFTATFVT